MSYNKKIRLSPSAIESLNRCPRCFWLHRNKGIAQPEGIVSRLANRFDIILKNYCDIYRKIGELPPIFGKKLRGKLENPFQEKYFYDYDDPSIKLGTGKYTFEGRLDDCLITDEGKYAPIDFKTASSDPREKKEILPAYQNQMDSYAFLLEKNGKKTSGESHLIFIYPDNGKELHSAFPMVIHIVTLKTNPGEVGGRISKAIEILEGDMPDSSPDCPFCQWYREVGEELNKN